MALSMLPSLAVALPPSQCRWKAVVQWNPLISSNNSHRTVSIAKIRGSKVKAFFPNPTEEPILKEALKEPVAFVGGMFAGLLRLDLKEEPLREWVARTVEASGISAEEISKRNDEGDEEMPQEIEIE